MEHPPPVPPKDVGYTARMDLDRPSTSGSKRKREAFEEFIHSDPFESPEPDAHTPKRSRSNPATDSESNTPVNKRSVRRKKGSRNLSQMSLRHAAQQQADVQSPVRGSKFQEGSLNDKPSEEPPSVYTRAARTESGNLRYVEDLMANYHDGVETPRSSVEAAVEREKVLLPQRVSTITAQNTKKDDGRGFFQFGRQFASNFHPVTLWNKLWTESKDQLDQEDIEKAERKARQKAEAEAKYAELKQAGQLGLKPVGTLRKRASQIYGGIMQTPRDSAVAFDSTHPSMEQARSVSAASQRMEITETPAHETTVHETREVPDSTSKLGQTVKSRLHNFKRASFSNLKRPKSDYNLVAAASNRESSSSVSPVKVSFDGPTLQKSASKFDLRKQHKLSKRVSDLEGKLEQARRELDDALVEASPMPKLGSRFERFAPAGTMKRPKFVPGGLPTLPSERLLNPDMIINTYEGERESKPRKGMDISLTEFLAKRQRDMSEDDQETIKARATQVRPHVSVLFSQDNNNIENQTPPNDKQSGQDQTEHKDNEDNESVAGNMDPNTSIQMTNNPVSEPAKKSDYASLDAKLKALDANVKTARKANKPKKRKPVAGDEDKMFKPGTESDDDAEWEEAKGRKKHKSASGKNSSSPVSAKKAKTSPPKPTGLKSSPTSKKTVGKKVPVPVEEEADSEQDVYSADELAKDEFSASRISVDSVATPLAPVYETEEDEVIEETTITTSIPLNTEPSKPTAKATPASRLPRNGGLRSRSNSPHKRNPSSSDEQLITRAALAAQQHPGRTHGRSASPPPAGSPRAEKLATVGENEVVSLTPGRNGVPKLPGAMGEKQARAGAGGEEFEWPDDVF